MFKPFFSFFLIQISFLLSSSQVFLTPQPLSHIPRLLANAAGASRIDPLSAVSANNPQLCSLLNGALYVTLWDQANSVYGKVYSSIGYEMTGDFRIDTSTSSKVLKGCATLNSGNSFVTVWRLSTGGIYAAIFSSKGTVIKSEFQVHEYTSGNQAEPWVVATKSGDKFAVAWQSGGQDVVSTLGIYGKIYNSDGTVIKSEFQVNTHTTNDQKMPTVYSLGSDSKLLITWISNLQDGSSTGVYFRIFDWAGNSLTSEIRANSFTTNAQEGASVADLESQGRFAFVWQSSEQLLLWDIFMRIFDYSGNEVFSETNVNQVTANQQGDAVIISMQGGDKFIIAWQSVGVDGTDQYDIMGKIYSYTGAVVQSDAILNPGYNHNQLEARMILLNNTCFAISWNQYTSTSANNFRLKICCGTFSSCEMLSLVTGVSTNLLSMSLIGLEGGNSLVGAWATNSHVYANLIYNTPLYKCKSSIYCPTYLSLCEYESCVICSVNGSLSVANGSRYYFEDLQLNYTLSMPCSVDDYNRANIQYEWSCSRFEKNIKLNCLDPMALFNSNTSIQNLTIPSFTFSGPYFDFTTIYEITVKVCTNYSCSTSSQNVTITNPNEFIAGFPSNNNKTYNDEDLQIQSIILNQSISSPLYYMWKCYVSIDGTLFAPCSNYAGFFGINSSNSTLHLPSFFFQVNRTLDLSWSLYKFTVNISSDFNSTMVEIVCNVSDRFRFTLSPSENYSYFYDYNFTASEYDLSGLNPISSYWIIDGLQIASGPFLEFYNNTIQFNFSQEYIFVKFVEVHSLFERWTQKLIRLRMPSMTPPLNGKLFLFPDNKFGLVAITSGWQALNPILGYRFSYIDSKGAEIFGNFSIHTTQGFNFTGRPLTDTLINVSVEVQDYNGLKTKIWNTSQLVYEFSDVKGFVNSFIQELGTFQNSFNSSTVSSSINLWAQNMYALESYLINSISDPCPACSSKGVCPVGNTVCNCFVGWTLDDCSLDASVAAKIIEMKERILDVITNSSLVNNLTSDTITQLTDLLNLFSNKSDLNSQNTIKQMTNIADTIMNSSFANNLTLIQVENLAKFTDNTFEYIQNNDCSVNSSFYINQMGKLDNYIDKLSASLLKNATLGKPPDIFKYGFYEIFTVKMHICELNSYVLTTKSPYAPDIRVYLNMNNVTNCSDIISVQFISYDESLFKCNQYQSIFSNISVKIFDERGKRLNIEADITITFKNEKYVNCDTRSCTKQDLVCKCEDVQLDSFESQIYGKIFKSQLKNLLNFKGFSWENFINFVPFWMLAGTLLIFGFIVIIVRKCQNYDLIQSSRHKSNLSMNKRILIVFMVSQSIFRIFLRKDQLPKSIMAYMYYMQTLMMLTFSSIFGIDDSDEQDKGLWETMTTFDFKFDPYLLIITILTIKPIVGLINMMFNCFWIRKSDNIFAKAMLKKKIFAMTLTIFLILCCNFFIFNITSNLGKSGMNQWLINFIFMQVQDIFISPLVNLFIIFLQKKLLFSKSFKKMKRVHSKFAGFLRKESYLKKKKSSNRIEKKKKDFNNEINLQIEQALQAPPIQESNYETDQIEIRDTTTPNEAMVSYDAVNQLCNSQIINIEFPENKIYNNSKYIRRKLKNFKFDH